MASWIRSLPAACWIAPASTRRLPSGDSAKSSTRVRLSVGCGELGVEAGVDGAGAGVQPGQRGAGDPVDRRERAARVQPQAVDGQRPDVAPVDRGAGTRCPGRRWPAPAAPGRAGRAPLTVLKKPPTYTVLPAPAASAYTGPSRWARTRVRRRRAARTRRCAAGCSGSGRCCLVDGREVAADDDGVADHRDRPHRAVEHVRGPVDRVGRHRARLGDVGPGGHDPGQRGDGQREAGDQATAHAVNSSGTGSGGRRAGSDAVRPLRSRGPTRYAAAGRAAMPGLTDWLDRARPAGQAC